MRSSFSTTVDRRLTPLFLRCLPVTVSEDRGLTWTPQNIDPELPQRDTWIDNKWREAMVLGHIPQVRNLFFPPPAPSYVDFSLFALTTQIVQIFVAWEQHRIILFYLRCEQ